MDDLPGYTHWYVTTKSFKNAGIIAPTSVPHPAVTYFTAILKAFSPH